MTLQRQEIKERLDIGSPHKTIVDLDEIIEKWVRIIYIYRRIRCVCMTLIVCSHLYHLDNEFKIKNE
jgi:hypothetical protein